MTTTTVGADDRVTLSVADVRTVLDTLDAQRRESWADNRSETLEVMTDLRRALDKGGDTVSVHPETAWWTWHLDASLTLYNLDGAEEETYEHPVVKAFMAVGEAAFDDRFRDFMISMDRMSGVEIDAYIKRMPRGVIAPDGLYAIANPLDPEEMTFWRASTHRRTGMRHWMAWPQYATYRSKLDRPASRALWHDSVRLAVAVDPLPAGALFGAIQNLCFRCYRRLTDATSKTYGIGPDCRSSFTPADLARCAEVTRRWIGRDQNTTA